MISIDYDKELLIINNYIEMKRYSHALERLGRLLAEQPADAYLLYLNAHCLYMLDRYDEAVDSCRVAADSGFDLGSCYYLLSKIRMRTDEYVEAEKLLREALGIDPQNADYLARLGYLMMISGKKYRSLELINQALEIEPENLSALQYKFYYYLDMEDSRGIKSKVVEKYFALSTNECDRFLKAGMLDCHSGNYKSAEENFRQAFQIDPTNKFILEMLKKTSRRPRFFFYLKNQIRSVVMKKLALVYTILKSRWILFKCVGLTRQTMIFITVPVGLLLLIVMLLVIIL